MQLATYEIFFIHKDRYSHGQSYSTLASLVSSYSDCASYTDYKDLEFPEWEYLDQTLQSKQNPASISFNLLRDSFIATNILDSGKDIKGMFSPYVIILFRTDTATPERKFTGVLDRPEGHKIISQTVKFTARDFSHLINKACDEESLQYGTIDIDVEAFAGIYWCLVTDEDNPLRNLNLNVNYDYIVIDGDTTIKKIISVNYDTNLIYFDGNYAGTSGTKVATIHYSYILVDIDDIFEYIADRASIFFFGVSNRLSKTNNYEAISLIDYDGFPDPESKLFDTDWNSGWFSLEDGSDIGFFIRSGQVHLLIYGVDTEFFPGIDMVRYTDIIFQDSIAYTVYEKEEDIGANAWSDFVTNYPEYASLTKTKTQGNNQYSLVVGDPDGQYENVWFEGTLFLETMDFVDGSHSLKTILDEYLLELNMLTISIDVDGSIIIRNKISTSGKTPVTLNEADISDKEPDSMTLNKSFSDLSLLTAAGKSLDPEFVNVNVIKDRVKAVYVNQLGVSDRIFNFIVNLYYPQGSYDKDNFKLGELFDYYYDYLDKTYRHQIVKVKQLDPNEIFFRVTGILTGEVT